MSAAIAADNVVVALYFTMLFSLAKSEPEDTCQRDNNEDFGDHLRDPEDVTGDDSRMTMPSLAVSMSVAACLVTIGKALTKIFFPKTSVSLFQNT